MSELQVRRNGTDITAVRIQADTKTGVVWAMRGPLPADVAEFLAHKHLAVNEDGPGWWVVRRRDVE